MFFGRKLICVNKSSTVVIKLKNILNCCHEIKY